MSSSEYYSIPLRVSIELFLKKARRAILKFDFGHLFRGFELQHFAAPVPSKRIGTVNIAHGRMHALPANRIHESFDLPTVSAGPSHEPTSQGTAAVELRRYNTRFLQDGA